MNENHCVCCGAVIPEGRQVCKQCEKKYEIRWGDSIIQAVYRKGFKDGQYDLIQTLIERYEMPEDSKLKEILCKQNERKQGHWLVYRSAVKCSICKTLTSCLVEKPDFRYCPHCGARMFSEETT